MQKTLSNNLQYCVKQNSSFMQAYPVHPKFAWEYIGRIWPSIGLFLFSSLQSPCKSKAEFLFVTLLYFLYMLLISATTETLIVHTLNTKTSLLYKSNNLDMPSRGSEVRAEVIWNISFVTNTVNVWNQHRNLRSRCSDLALAFIRIERPCVIVQVYRYRDYRWPFLHLYLNEKNGLLRYIP